MKNLFNIISILLISILAVSCGDINVDFDDDGERIKGNNVFVTEDRDVTDFENLRISHFFKIILQQGEFDVAVEAESNLMKYILTEVKDGTLKVRRKKGFRLKTEETPKIYITMPDLQDISFDGAGSFETKGVFEAENVALKISGGVEIDLNLDCNSLRTELSGAADFDLEGSAERFSINTSGAGSIDAEDFVTEFSKINVSGAASVKVHTTDRLEARISGVGSIRYAGNPENIDKHVSGLGSIKPI